MSKKTKSKRWIVIRLCIWLVISVVGIAFALRDVNYVYSYVHELNHPAPDITQLTLHQVYIGVWCLVLAFPTYQVWDNLKKLSGEKK